MVLNGSSVVMPLCLKCQLLLSQRLELCLDYEPKDQVKDGYGVDDPDRHDEDISSSRQHPGAAPQQGCQEC